MTHCQFNYCLNHRKISEKFNAHGLSIEPYAQLTQQLIIRILIIATVCNIILKNLRPLKSHYRHHNIWLLSACYYFCLSHVKNDSIHVKSHAQSIFYWTLTSYTNNHEKQQQQTTISLMEKISAAVSFWTVILVTINRKFFICTFYSHKNQ